MAVFSGCYKWSKERFYVGKGVEIDEKKMNYVSTLINDTFRYLLHDQVFVFVLHPLCFAHNAISVLLAFIV